MRIRDILLVLAVIVLVAAGVFAFVLGVERVDRSQTDKTRSLALPEMKLSGDISVEEALANRRSVRDYRNAPLTLAHVSQLLWAAQGITEPESGKRTAPSAGALYPLEVYLAARNVEGLAPGVYKYDPRQQALLMVKDGDVLPSLSAAALGQQAVEEGAIAIVIAAVYERTAQKYGDRGARYVHMEVGAAVENVYLQAESLGLGTVIIGAFDDDEVQTVIGMEEDEMPLAIIPVGRI
jgi:SagB-type dehydrogenase family enzyme